jgi:alpha-ketoglutarate-dependent taurine dioxygenase
MKITLHNNGWTVIIDEDLRTLTQEEIFEVCKLIVKNTVVVFRNQTLTEQDELKFCKTIGGVQPTRFEHTKNLSLSNGILRVTGKKNEQGEPGLFGHKAVLDWHCNSPGAKTRHPIIWLYGVEGTSGSKTSWINNALAYNDLPEDFKKEINNIEIFCGYETGKFSDSDFFRQGINYANPLKLVYTNIAGETGLFFPFLQIFGFKDKSEDYFNSVMKRLTEHILQEKYMYHHDWQDGDVVIAEQWLGIHKRWPFEGMGERILHRIAFNYYEVFHSQ